MAYTIEQTNRDVVTLRHAGVSADWSQRYLISSDIHLDSPFCNRRLFRSYLDRARDVGAGVFIFGDLNDVMQWRQDKRGDKSALLPQLKAGDYINRVVDDTVEFLYPYRDIIAMISEGNHESELRKHLEVDILMLIASRLGVIKMGYSGYVRFLFSRTEAAKGHGTGGNTSRVMYFHHGSGGGGEVTKGVMRAQRQSAYIGDADIMVGGHYHEGWRLETERLRLSSKGEVYHDRVLHVCLPTFKDEFDMAGGFHVERGRPPKPQGAYWLEFRHNCAEHGRVDFDVSRAG